MDIVLTSTWDNREVTLVTKSGVAELAGGFGKSINLELVGKEKGILLLLHFHIFQDGLSSLLTQLPWLRRITLLFSEDS